MVLPLPTYRCVNPDQAKPYQLNILLFQTLAEQLSYLHAPRPFKNPNYVKNVNRRPKNLKAVLTQERERDRLWREQKKQEKLESMDVDGEGPPEGTPEEDVPTCMCPSNARDID